MITIKVISSVLLSLALIFFITLSTSTAFAQSVGCTITKIGNPAGPQPSLPDICGTSGVVAGPIAQKAITLARAQIGKEYIFASPSRDWASENPDANRTPSNFDCSGLTGWSYYWASGGKVNMHGQTQDDWDTAGGNYLKVFYNASQKTQFLNQLQPGDMLYWSTPSNVHHTALYIGKALGAIPGKDPSLFCSANTTDCFVEAYSTGYALREKSLGPRMYDLLGFLRPIIK